MLDPIFLDSPRRVARWSERKGKKRARAERDARVASAKARGQKGSRSRAETELRDTAIHEAVHLIVAHALGRHPVYARVVPKLLAAGDPINRTGAPLLSMGYARADPAMAEEIDARIDAEQPLTDEQRRWLGTEIVIGFAGWVIQRSEAVHGDAVDDLSQVGRAATALGLATEQPDGQVIINPALQEIAIEAANTILQERWDKAEDLARALQEHGELDEAELGEILAGLSQGSHEHLLDEVMILAAGPVTENIDQT
jgi:hypothetical protein